METEAVLGRGPASYDLGSLVSPEFRPDWLGGNGQPFRVIDDEGGVDERLVADLAPAILKGMYEEMAFARAFDTRMVQLQRQGRIAFCVTSTGQEAALIGSAYALEPNDRIFSAYRELATALHRGVPLETVLAQFFGTSADLLKGRQMPNHFGCGAVHYSVASSPVGTQIPHATGAAYALRLRGERHGVIVYFGDGATSTGDFHGGMNFAGVQQLPVVFFCQNNGWAISLPVERQTASATLAQKAQAYGFDGVRVDGNDVLAVYLVTLRAMEKARSGGGPTMIEAVTYRMGPHSTADDSTRYRPEALLEEWHARSPLDRFRRYLERRGLWNAAEEDRLQGETEAKLAAAIERSENQPPPPVASMFEDVYADLPWHLVEQREEILR